MGTHPIFESDFDCLTEMDIDEEIHSLNRREARIRGNGSQLASDNSVIRRKSCRRNRRKSPTEIDLNSKKTPEKLKMFAKADRQLEHVANMRSNKRETSFNSTKNVTSPLLRKETRKPFKRNSRYPPVEEAMKDTTKLGQTWIKENQLGNLKK